MVLANCQATHFALRNQNNVAYLGGRVKEWGISLKSSAHGVVFCFVLFCFLFFKPPALHIMKFHAKRKNVMSLGVFDFYPVKLKKKKKKILC